MVILDTRKSASNKRGRIRQVALDKYCHPKAVERPPHVRARQTSTNIWPCAKRGLRDFTYIGGSRAPQTHVPSHTLFPTVSLPYHGVKESYGVWPSARFDFLPGVFPQMLESIFGDVHESQRACWKSGEVKEINRVEEDPGRNMN